MCRLFGMHAGTTTADATFWLVGASDSLSHQSRLNPDGFGVGAFAADGHPVVDKAALPAWKDPAFASAAHRMHGTTFVAHVRKASTGAIALRNTHPFLQQGRLFAHNGGIGGLDRLDTRLAERNASMLVEGDTDSERLFALITAETARHGGDVEAGITDAVGWVAQNLPVFALNFVMITPTDLWALRYPATHELFVLDRPGQSTSAPAFHGHGSQLDTHSDHLASHPAVIVASERIDDDPRWRAFEPGELIHVSANLEISSSQPFPAEPAHPIDET